MILQELTTQNFRNLQDVCFVPCAGINIISGDNAQGKTNLLEAICYLSSLSSFRSVKDGELCAYGKDSFAINAKLLSQEREKKLEIRYEGNKKSVYVNHVRLKKRSDVGEVLHCVIFSPEDLSLPRDSAAARRRFFDEVICSVKPGYAGLLREYQHLLASKTRILKDHFENPSLLDTLDTFSARMCQIGTEMMVLREQFAQTIEHYAQLEHTCMSNAEELLSIRYQSLTETREREPSAIFDAFWQHMMTHRSAEIASGSCLSGPHKDDFHILINGREAKNNASQGQTRSAVIALKLAQAYLYRDTAGEYPLVLLDDVLSELDRRRKTYVMNGIRSAQVLITSCETDSDLITASDNVKLFHMVSGQLRIGSSGIVGNA